MKIADCVLFIKATSKAFKIKRKPVTQLAIINISVIFFKKVYDFICFFNPEL